MPQKYGLTGKQSFLYVTRTLCYVARMKNVLIFIKKPPVNLILDRRTKRQKKDSTKNNFCSCVLLSKKQLERTSGKRTANVPNCQFFPRENPLFRPVAGISRKYAILVRFPQYHLTVNHIRFRQKVRKKTIQTKPKERKPTREAANR